MAECESVQIGAEQILVCSAPSFWWVTPCVIVLSALIAGFLSWKSIQSTREMATKRATLDFIERSESNAYYQDIYTAFSEVRKDQGGLVQLCSPTNPELLRQRQKVINYLNHYELMAMGIREEMLDEDVYKGFMRGTLVRDWAESEQFINHLRAPTADSGSEVSTSEAFCEFEELAKKWSPEVQMNLPIEGE